MILRIMFVYVCNHDGAERLVVVGGRLWSNLVLGRELLWGFNKLRLHIHIFMEYRCTGIWSEMNEFSISFQSRYKREESKSCLVVCCLLRRFILFSSCYCQPKRTGKIDLYILTKKDYLHI